MVLAVSLLVLTVLVLPLLLVGMLRNWGRDAAETEKSLLAPEAHTVSWVVPEGEDPAVVRTHLAHAGFVSILDRSGDQRLVVHCEDGDRERVRSIIERTDHIAYDGHALHPHPHFEDDPA
jgi:hypothetical protein